MALTSYVRTPVLPGQDLKTFVNQELAKIEAALNTLEKIKANWLNVQKFLGLPTAVIIGTTVENPNPTAGDPPHRVDIVNDNSTSQGIRYSTYGPSGTVFQNTLHYVRALGTLAAPTPIQAGDFLASTGYRGCYAAGVISGSVGSCQVVTTENWDGSHLGLKIYWEVCPTGGATARQPIFELAADLTANIPVLYTNGSTSASAGYMVFKDTSGTRYGYIGKTSSANTDIALESDHKLQLVANNGASGRIVIDAGITVTGSSGATAAIGLALDLSNQTVTTASPAAGGAGALPATPAGYLGVTINGTARKVPFY